MSSVATNYGIRRNKVIYICIFFQATKFTADHVDERIEAFIDWYVNDKLKVSKSQKGILLSSNVSKNQRNCLRISAQASKMGKIGKNK